MADLLIVTAILISVLSAFFKGLLVEFFSLAGLIVGLLIAAADSARFAPWLLPWVKNFEVADLVAFLLISGGVMLLAGLLGRLLRKAFRLAGLGFLDRLGGAFFGLLRGVVLGLLIVVPAANLFPDSAWVKNSRLVPLFLALAQQVPQTMHRFEMEQKIQRGVQTFRNTQWRRNDRKNIIPGAARDSKKEVFCET